MNHYSTMFIAANPMEKPTIKGQATVCEILRTQANKREDLHWSVF